MEYPLYQELDYHNPLDIFSLFHHYEGAVFLDSAQLQDNCGQYSYIGFDPYQLITAKNGTILINHKKIISDSPFDYLEKELAQFSYRSIQSIPPFQGGLLGYFGYEASHYLEKLPKHKIDDMQFPDIAVGLYDVIIAFDNLNKKAWVISTGFPHLNQEERKLKAQSRLDTITQMLIAKPKSYELSTSYCNYQDIIANFQPFSYQAAVDKVINYILAGDIFEANISQRFKTQLPDNLSAFDLYKRLRKINPAPFAAYLNFPEIILASASPERFLRLNQNHVEARPIKGTRPRGKTPAEDRLLAEELLQSEKDHAENIMIVDLMRNDISRVCKDHTVLVPKLCGLESFASVHHLVSVVTGELNAGISAIDLLKATFPGGSITGAPKIRAMEIIAEIEPTTRGPYCGSIGFIGFNGNMDTSITIRTFCIKDKIATFQVGGAIVADSNPHDEYHETLAKAKALLNALTGSA